jgi:rhodanese-related sulfurtransferase
VAKRKYTDKPKTPQTGARKPAVSSGKKAQSVKPSRKGQSSQPTRKEVQRQKMTRREIPWFTIAIFAIAAVGLALIVGYRLLNPSTGAEISVTSAYEKYEEGAFLLDVREEHEWNGIRIPNTTWIPLGELAERTNELPRDQEIVVVCRTGNRSQEGRDILLAAGFEQVSSMAGGVVEWSALGYPIE